MATRIGVDVTRRPTGMQAFMIISIGQFVSLLGSGMTALGISIWAWQETGQATALSLAGFFFMGPTILLSPLAGALVDRSNRKLVMIVSDLAAGLMTAILLILSAMGELQIWHIYVTNAFSGAFQAFQFPAYSAAVSTMVAKEEYGRANGIQSLAAAASGILSPMAAAAAYGLIGITGIMVVDVVTFCVAIGVLLFVHVPQPAPSQDDKRVSLWQDSLFGFRYIRERPSLLGLLTVFVALNLFISLAMNVTTPMVLARTGNNEVVLGTARSIAGVGMVVGSLLLSTWGGPKRRVYGVLGGMIGSALLGPMLLGLARGLPLWSVGGFLMGFFMPLLNGSSQAIWQAKVPPALQGRVFAVRRLIAQVLAPIAMLAAGPLADYVFEPAMRPGGALVGVFGGLVGTGPGAGMSLMMVIFGLAGAISAAVAFAVPTIRNVEDILPDHDAAAI